MDDLETRIRPGKFIKHLARTVGRSIVDKNHFAFPKRLAGKRIQAALQKSPHIEHGDDDGHFHQGQSLLST